MPVSRGARLASLLGNSSADRKSKLKGYEESASKAQTVGNLKGVANQSMAIKAFENLALQIKVDGVIPFMHQLTSQNTS